MINKTINDIIANIQRVIVGKDDVLKLAMTALLCEGHILFDDVPGTGKTTLARAIAATLDCTFRRIQFTPDLLPTDVTGLSWYNQKLGEFEYRPGPIMSQIVLADEINRATPRTQSALLEAMQERQVTVDGESRQLNRPFMVIATQNPVELEGTFPLPEAQLDRFLLRITMGYPTQSEEADILKRFKTDDPLATLTPVVDSDEIIQMQRESRYIQVEESVIDYIVRIARETRVREEIRLGASPRATMGLFQASQAWAAIHGRAYVLPDDVKAVAPNVLCHRLIVAPQAQLRGRTADELIRDIITSVPVPVES